MFNRKKALRHGLAFKEWQWNEMLHDCKEKVFFAQCLLQMFFCLVQTDKKEVLISRFVTRSANVTKLMRLNGTQIFMIVKIIYDV